MLKDYNLYQEDFFRHWILALNKIGSGQMIKARLTKA